MKIEQVRVVAEWVAVALQPVVAPRAALTVTPVDGAYLLSVNIEPVGVPSPGFVASPAPAKAALQKPGVVRHPSQNAGAAGAGAGGR